MKKVFLCLPLFLMLLFSVKITAQYHIKGKVIDKITKEPLSGANILVNNNKGCATGNDGSFNLDIQEKKIVLVITHLGYNSLNKQISLSKGENAFEFQLDEFNYTFETVEISAKGFLSEEMRTAARIQTIQLKEISNIPAQNVEDVLQYATGIDVDNTLGMFSDNAVVSMRGMGGNDQGRTLIIIDGVPANKSDGGSVNWNAINKNNLKEIKITQGAASTVYGANAMGGVIDIRTKMPSDKFMASADITYGTYNTLIANAAFGHSMIDSTQKGTFWNATLHGGASDGYITEAEEYLEYGEDTLLRPAFFKEASAGLKIGHAFSSKEKILLSVKGFTDKRGKGWQVFDYDGSFSSHNDLDARLHYNKQISNFIYWESNAYFRFENYLKQNEYINSDDDYSMYEVDSKRYDAGWLNMFNFQYGRNLFKGGVDLRFGAVNASDNYFTTTDSIVNKGMIAIGAAFIQDEISLLEEKLTITAGLRYDYAAFFKGKYMVYYPSKKINYLLHFQDTLMPETNWSAISPRLSILFTNKKNIRVYASWSTGFRPPTLDDLCRSQSSGSYFRVANPYLKDEYITNFELGGDVLIGKATRVSLSAFFSEGKDFMYDVSTGDSVDIGYKIVPVYKMDNISKMQAWGIETSFSSEIFKGVSCFANYSFTPSKITEYTMVDPLVDYDLTGKYLANVPMHNASAGISLENKIINVNILWKFKGERYINDRNTIDVRYFNSATYPSYQTVSLKVWRAIAYGINVALSVDNITNEIYLNSKGQRCPGRMVMLEVNWSL